MEESASESATAAGADGPAAVSAPDLLAPAAPPIERDWACCHCGYNLRGLTADRCPECGGLIEDSARVADCRRDARWIARLRRGLLVLWIAELCLLLLTLPDLCSLSLLGVFLFPPSVRSGIGIGYASVRLVGTWLFTSPQSPNYQSLNLRRGSLLLRSLAILLLLGTLWRMGLMLSAVGEAPEYLDKAFEVLAGGAFFLGYVACCGRARLLAAVSGQARLARFFRILRWPYIVLLVNWILIQIVPPIGMAIVPWINRFILLMETIAFWTLATLHLGGPFLAGFALIILMERLRRALADWR